MITTDGGSMLRKGIVLVTVLGMAGCGDPGADPDRGYVKPPLETPGLVVKGEDVSEMVELGEPIRPRPKEPSEVVEQDDAG
jgi:hypothetical protein